MAKSPKMLYTSKIKFKVTNQPVLRNLKTIKKSCVASRYGHKQMLCPSRSSHHYDVCITSEQLCDDNIDCPGGEDENAINCLFYKSTKEQLKHIYNTVLLLADHATKQNSHREL
ncbi:unnamed protein product [Dracunculus medinensis]|uniref:Sortilin_C domain-containing protein n=1 Tax=Dracunculus medinensis TaxID=318479 RepID=A0A0N4UB46_DRAME|nr:unnamed protein product [Dracunculus medinensis]